MNCFLGEFFGTFLMILLGNGVVANILLSKSKGIQGGWIVSSLGWGFAVTMAIYFVGYVSGAHLNPAVTLAFVLSKATPLSQVPFYLAGQFLGAMVGAFFVWLTYYSHFKETQDSHMRLLCFCTSPAIHNLKWNAVTEIIATTVLILGVFSIVSPHNHVSPGFNPYIIGILVASIGLSLGGPTGYAINPARDIGPRIMYTLLYGRETAHWSYAWVPLLAPLIGSSLAFLIYSTFFNFS